MIFWRFTFTVRAVLDTFCADAGFGASYHVILNKLNYICPNINLFNYFNKNPMWCQALYGKEKKHAALKSAGDGESVVIIL